jgi:hypothetical protein
MRQYWLAIVPIVAVAFGVYLNRRAPDVRYQLTTPIPVETVSTDALKSVQLLEVGNLGNSPAQKLRIQIRKKVGSLNVVPNSMADTYKQYDTDSATELVYETLPPQGRIKWIFTSNGGVTEQDLTVSHLDGLGRAALTSDTGILATVVKNLWVVVALLYLFWFLKDINKSFLDSEASYDPLAVLKRKNRLLISESAWTRIRSKAIDHVFQDEWATDVLKWDGRHMLDSGRPPYLNEDEWRKLVNNLVIKMAKLFEVEVRSARTGFRTDTLGILLKLKRPSHFPEREWSDALEKLEKNYIASFVDSQRWHEATEIADVIRSGRPEFITEDGWKKCRQEIGDIYYSRLATAVATLYEPMDELVQWDLSVLDERQRRAMKEFAYCRQMARLPDVTTPHGAEEFLERPRPKWMAEKDYENLRDSAARCKEFIANRDQYRSLVVSAHDFVADVEVGPNQPSVGGAEAWAKVKAILENVRARARENSLLAAELETDRSDLDRLKTRVLRQLEVLDRFLQDPDIVDRIEPYEEVFAPGNLANLREIGGLARTGKKA